MAREGRSHSGLADVLQQGDGTTCGRSRYRKLADVVAEKAAAPEIGSCRGSREEREAMVA